MTRLRATSIATFLTIAALVIGACGGDDSGSNDSAATGTDATEAATGTTETGTTSTGKTETRERAETKKRKSSGGGSSGGSGGSGGGNSGGSGKSGGSGNSGKDESPEKQLTGKNVFTTSKTVCANFLPTALAKDLKEGKKSAEDIAKDYSAGYPAAERKRAYEGCLAGLKNQG
jgi:hypothetical protein